jgi:hypothetical protein
MVKLGRETATGQLARPGQLAVLSQVAGQPVVSSNGPWMSVLNTATGLFAIGMPTHLGFGFGFQMAEKPQ